MITIVCAKCGQKLFKYLKIGEGKILRCFKERITKDQAVHQGLSLECPCGNQIGEDRGEWYKMKQHAFTYTGKKQKS